MCYGAPPTDLGLCETECTEMLFYQYLPVKLAGGPHMGYHHLESRLHWLTGMLGRCCCDFVGLRGLDEFNDSYVYVTAKHMWQTPGCSYNREGWHSDGFMTNDINYIWSNACPTIFNIGYFNISQDDKISMRQMEEQAKEGNNRQYNNMHVLRLDQFNIHKVAPVTEPVLRTFVKISISKDKYDLIGNSVNPLLDYNWEYKSRKAERNIPQSCKT